VDGISRDPVTLAYHELRSPLGLIATVARSAADECVDETTRRRWEVVTRAAERTLRTADQVLSLAKRDDSEATPRWYRPAAIIAQLVRDFQGLGVPVELKSTPQGEGALLYGVRERLEALAQSLITNALDHGEPGSAQVRIAASDAIWSMSIVNRIVAVRSHRGLGAGMYVSVRMAERMGGQLSTSNDGRIYRIRLSLPLCESADEDVAEAADRGQQHGVAF